MSELLQRVRKALVVGGGIGGMSAAIVLRRLGIDVCLIDLDPNWRVYGAGISITGATMRAFEGLGVLKEVMAEAWGGDGIQICDRTGQPLQVLTTPRAAPHLPGCGGIMRPLLHQILSGHTVKLGTKVRLGITVDSLNHDEGGVGVRFSDGGTDRFDLVVGADGVFSHIRQLLFPNAPKPQYTGQYIWRIVAPRPAHINCRYFFLGGPVKVGLTPVSREHMYMFLLEPTPRQGILEGPALPVQLERLLDGYGGPLAGILDRLVPGTGIIVRPLECFLLPAPWHAGRTLLIGDAAHPTTPQLASGAGMAVEDALVLGEELGKAGDFAELCSGFMKRRYERCRLVVENSIEIGHREQRRAPIEEQTALVEESLRVLAQPI